MIDNLSTFFSEGQNLVFLALSVLIICGAVYMLSFTRVVHMVVSVALTFVSLSGLYMMLGAEFAGIVQVLIYGGAMTILMAFGIMMTNRSREEEQPKRPLHNALLFIGTLALLGVLIYAIQSVTFPDTEPLQTSAHNTQDIGKQMYTAHVIPFELISVLLTVAFIGAIVLAKREEE